ncbi:MAG TPA: CHAT domain-containing tetratricopeptide repeat protein [Pirellulales bacterium]|nr:CHAT domain-containing tetratricopeptide repeat protein [Pirellulales bacterium]
MQRSLTAALLLSLLAVRALAAEESFDVVVTASAARVMAGTQPIGEVPNGTHLTATQTNGDWYLIDVPGANPPQRGWISKADVENAPASQNEAPLSPQQQEQWGEIVKLNAQTVQLYRRHKYQEALVAVQKTLQLFKQIGRDNTHDYAIVVQNLESVYEDLKDFDNAVPAQRQVLALIGKTLGEKHADYLDSWVHFDNLLTENYQQHESHAEWDAARASLMELLVLRSRRYGAGDQRTTEVRLQLGYLAKLANLSEQDRRRLVEAKQLMEKVQALGAEGKYDEAIPRGERALEINRQLLGTTDVRTGDAANWLGWLYDRKGDAARAESLYREALAGFKIELGPKHASCQSCWMHLNELLAKDAASQENRGDWEAARKSLAERLELTADRYGESAWRTIDARAALAAADKWSQLSKSERSQLDETVHASQQAVKLRSEGKLKEAIGTVEQAIQTRRTLVGDVDGTWRGWLESLAQWYEESKDAARAESLYRDSVEVRKQSLGQRHPLYAIRLNALSSLLERKGDAAGAATLRREADEIEKHVLGDAKDADFEADATYLANVYEQWGDHARAEPLYRHAVEVQAQLLGTRHADFLESQRLWNLALTNLIADDVAHGKWDAGRKALSTAIDSTDRIYGSGNWRAAGLRGDTTYYVEKLSRLSAEDRRRLSDADKRIADGSKLLGEGKYEEAIRAAEEALDTRRKLLGDADWKCAEALHLLGRVCIQTGDYARAEKVTREALEIRKRVFGEKHPLYASSAYSLGYIYFSLGDYARAEPLLQQASEIRKSAFGERDAEYANILSSLAFLYENMGDYALAEPLYLQAIDIHKAVGEKNASSARTFGDLAHLYTLKRQYAAAEPLYRQALEIDKKTLGEKHPTYAIALDNLAMNYMKQGEYARADPLLRQALELWKQSSGDQRPYYAVLLSNLAITSKNMGDFARAESLYRQALEIRKRTLGDQHPLVALSLRELASLLIAMRKPDDAVELASQSFEIARRQMDLTAEVQSERQQLAMRTKMLAPLNYYLSASAEAKTSGEQVYPAVLAWKGAVLARQQAIRSMLHGQANSQNPRVSELYQQFSETARELDNLSRATPPPEQAEQQHRRFGQLSEQFEWLQKQLAAVSGDFRRESAQRKRTPDDLRRALPADTVLVDLLEYDHYAPPSEKGLKVIKQRQFAAFVVRADRPVERIELGPAAPISDTIDRWRKTYSADQAAELRRLVWAPLEKELEGATTVLVSPDGPITRFPLAALPGRENGTYLIEDVAIATVAVPRMLPELLAGADVAAPPKPSLLVVGDVDFDAQPGRAPRIDQLASTAAPAAREGEPLHWGLLPGTRSEILAVADSFDQRFPDAPHQSLRKERATKVAVCDAMENCRYLHLATHGFFAPAQLRSAMAEATKAEATDAGNRFSVQDLAGYQPDLLSGLVFAGANHPPAPGEEDGILTALAVEQLDLSHVDLATLSACETGLGATAGGEGLLGLQRAFQTAGARTTVATLWTIPDDATRTLMTDFYENLWGRKLPKLEALRQAQLTMLRDGVKRGLKFAGDEPPKEGRLPPYYWAAFVLSGDWR